MQRDSAKSARVYFVIPFISKSPLEVLNYPSKREKKCCRTYDFLIINATAPLFSVTVYIRNHKKKVRVQIISATQHAAYKWLGFKLSFCYRQIFFY